MHTGEFASIKDDRFNRDIVVTARSAFSLFLLSFFIAVCFTLVHSCAQAVTFPKPATHLQLLQRKEAAKAACEECMSISHADCSPLVKDYIKLARAVAEQEGSR